MKPLLYLCITTVVAYAGVQAARYLWKAPSKAATTTEIPGFLPICGHFEGMELEVSHSEWWPQVVRHIKHEYPGYCLASFQIINPDGKLVVLYTVKSPDGQDSIHSSLEVKEITNI